MSQFKPGDLALIIGTTGRRPELIGTTVELMFSFSNIHGDLWAWRDGEKLECTQEKHLMPLRGDFQPEQQKSREVVE
jgi:hypothetical protein